MSQTLGQIAALKQVVEKQDAEIARLRVILEHMAKLSSYSDRFITNGSRERHNWMHPADFARQALEAKP